MKSIIAGILSIILFLQPLGLISPISAETIDMQYTDPDHLHAPKKVNETDYQYDANGNLVNDGERVISWNQDNMPTKIIKGNQTVEFFYDADGNRIIKKVGEDKIVYVSNSYQKSTIDGQETATKYYFANGRVAQSKEDNLSFLHQDHLGSNVLATDSDSQIIGKALSYFPYGNFVNNSVTQLSNNPKYFFTNQELDSETDLYNYNARLYNSKTGAFISADTVQGLNRYAYAANNPIMFTDPSGHMLDAGGGGGGGDLGNGLEITITGGSNSAPGIQATQALTIKDDPAPGLTLLAGIYFGGLALGAGAGILAAYGPAVIATNSTAITAAGEATRRGVQRGAAWVEATVTGKRLQEFYQWVIRTSKGVTERTTIVDTGRESFQSFSAQVSTEVSALMAKGMSVEQAVARVIEGYRQASRLTEPLVRLNTAGRSMHYLEEAFMSGRASNCFDVAIAKAHFIG